MFCSERISERVYCHPFGEVLCKNVELIISLFMKDNRQNFVRNIFRFCPGIIKWCLGVFVGCLLTVPSSAQNNQSPRVNLDVKNASLIEIIEELRVQTRYNFLFNSDELRSFSGISVRLNSVSLKQALDSLLIGRKTGLTFSLEDKTVVIR